jgi:Na+/proline symporter
MINDLGLLSYVYVALLGLVSYLICLKLSKTQGYNQMLDYLYAGNSPILALGSTLGTVFSVAILFTAMTALGMIYGYIAFLVILVSAYIGLWLVERRIDGLYNNKEFKKNNLHTYEQRFNLLFISKTNNINYLFIALIYIFFMCVTEIGALKNFIETNLDKSYYNSLILYVTVFCSIAYVYVGGFRGVLITDLIQTGIIVMATVLNLVLFIADNKVVIDPASKFINAFCTQGTDKTVLFVLGTSVLSVAWFSSAPEVWKRIVTLEKKKSAQKIFFWLKILLPFIMSMPVLYMMLSAHHPTGQISHETAYNLWGDVFLASDNRMISALFVVLITTAFFSTIDTYMVTCAQFIHNARALFKDDFIELFFKANPRRTSVLFVLVAFYIGIQLNTNFNAILGISAASVAIGLFYTMHIEKRISYFRKHHLQSFFMSVIPVVIILCISKMFTNKYNSGLLIYPLIPISISVMYLIIILYALIANKITKV